MILGGDGTFSRMILGLLRFGLRAVLTGLLGFGFGEGGVCTGGCSRFRLDWFRSANSALRRAASSFSSLKTFDVGCCVGALTTGLGAKKIDQIIQPKPITPPTTADAIANLIRGFSLPDCGSACSLSCSIKNSWSIKATCSG